MLFSVMSLTGTNVIKYTFLTGSTAFIYYNATNSTNYKVIFGTDSVYIKLHVE